MKRQIFSYSAVLLILIGCQGPRSVAPPATLTFATALEQTKDTLALTNCPSDMVEIDGDYCSHTDELCLFWVTIDGVRTDINTDRCGEYRQPVKCLVTPVHKHYCIDRHEFPNKKGSLPQDWMSFYDAERELKAVGKRVCTQSEWAQAALGPNLHPYPYGDGFHRNHMCNVDQHLAVSGVTGTELMAVSDPTSEVAAKIRSQLVTSGSMPECHSDFGVYDMVGNIDEWVRNESGNPFVSALMSGHQYGVRNRSTASTTAHGPSFLWYETGTRGCKDVESK